MKKGWEKGYKVVATMMAGHSGYRQSYVRRGKYEGEVRYPVGKEARPLKGNGPLCVFKSRRVANNSCGLPILVRRCVYRPSKRDKVWCRTRWGKDTKRLGVLPRGTRLATRVICLE